MHATKHFTWLIIAFISTYSLLVSSAVETNPAIKELMKKGDSYYQMGDYQNAATAYEKISTVEPSNATAFHQLGKSYGRLAQKSGWFQAIRLAKKTHSAFEQAANLDPSNVEILNDLIQFHNTAPGFLGGDKKKALQLKKILHSKK